MSNNRAEQQVLIDELTQIVDLSELKPALDQSGYVFKKDVAKKITQNYGAISVNFEIWDQVIISLIGNCTLSFAGLEDGQTGKLHVTKGALMTVAFAGVDSNAKGQVLGLTDLYFEVKNIGGYIHVIQLNRQSSGGLTIANFSSVNSASGEYSINGNVAQVSGVVNINPIDDYRFYFNMFLPFYFTGQLKAINAYMFNTDNTISGKITNVNYIELRCSKQVFIADTFDIYFSFSLTVD